MPAIKSILNELKDKAGAIALGAAARGTAAPVAKGPEGGAGPVGFDGKSADAVSALVNLGYGRTEALGAVAQAARSLGDDAGVDALIKAGLSELAPREVGR